MSISHKRHKCSMFDRDLAMKGDRFPLLLLPFPLLSRSFLSSFLPSSRLVQPFRGTVTRARVTQRDAWLFSRFFFPSLPPLVPSLFLYSPSFFSSARLPNSCAIVDIRERWRTSSFFSLESAGSARADRVTSWRRNVLADSRTQYARVLCVHVRVCHYW